MTRARTRRRLAALVLAAGAALLPTLATTPWSFAEDPSPSPTADDDSPAQILITKLAPRAILSTDGFFQVRGYVLNRGSQPLHDLTVRLRRGDKLSSRSDLATADTEPPATPVRVGRTPVRTAEQDVKPGARTTFDIRIRASQLQFGGSRSGVYPLKVEARARFGDSGELDSVGSVTTYLPWFPDGAPHGRVRIAWLWPLVDQPRRGPREVMLDDDLATSFSPGGRLDRMLRAAADGSKGRVCDAAPEGPPTLPPRPATTPCRADGVPVTYAVDPDLLFTAAAMTKPYQLLDGSKTKQIDDTGPAKTWLDGVRAATVGADVLSLPYADPDVVAMTAPSTGLADDVSLLREVGRQTTTDLLGRPPMTSVVWPPAGRLTRRAVESLTSAGASAVVVDQIALPAPESEPSFTPDTDVGRLPTSTGQPAVLSIDPVLSGLLTPSYDDYLGDRVVEQRWLAETAMISAERPSVSRTVLVAPARRADVHTAVAADAIRDTGRLPWLCGVSLASVATGSDTCSDEVPAAPDEEQPAVELEPPHSTDVMLSNRFLREIHALRTASSQFTDEVLAEPTSREAVGTTGRLTRARGRSESSAWRDDAGAGETMLKQLQTDVQALRNKVHLQIGRGTVTLTSTSGVISVNVVNELQQPVRVGVRLNARNQARLSTRGTPIATISGESARQINLKVTAQTSGKFVVEAQLVDRDGNPFGKKVDLVVRSTQYGRVALAVTGIGAGVLLAAVGIRIVRRALHHGRP